MTNERESRPFIAPDKLIVGEDTERLVIKLREYQARIEEFKPKIPGARDFRYFDSLYKAEIIQALTEKGEVSKEQIKKEIAAKYGEPVEDQQFSVAWNVISSYVLEGGKHNYGGSGLPKFE